MGFNGIYLPSGILNITTEFVLVRWPFQKMTIFHSYVELDPHGHMAYLNLQIELENMAKNM